MPLCSGKACVRVAERYTQILDLLDEVYQAKREPEIYGPSAIVTGKDIIAMVLCLCDILEPLCRLSLYLQGTAINFSLVTQQVMVVNDELYALIGRMRDNDPNLFIARSKSSMTKVTNIPVAQTIGTSMTGLTNIPKSQTIRTSMTRVTNIPVAQTIRKSITRVTDIAVVQTISE